MIFFGTKGKTVAGHVIEGIQCPSCESNQFATFGVIRYFHLYWIPTFPTSKTVGIECTHCKKTLVDKELPEALSKQIRANVFNKANTIPLFSGLFIIACLIMFGVYTEQQSGIREAAYIEQPSVNDLYIVDFNKIFTDIDPVYKYGLLRIKQISAGQVEFQVSKIAYNLASGIRKDIRSSKTSSDSYYESESLYVDLEKLKSMKESGAIYSIERI